MSIFLCWYPHR